MNTSAVPEPKPAYVVTNRSPLDRAIWIVVCFVVVFVVGFLWGQAHQQSVYNEAVEKAKQKLKQHGPALGSPATLRVSWYYNGKEMPDFTENPNCVLYKDPCPLELPSRPQGQPVPTTQQESSSGRPQLA